MLFKVGTLGPCF